MEDILSYDILPNCPLFDDDFPTKPVKHSLMVEIENALVSDDYLFNSVQKTTVVVDFMSQIKMLKLTTIACFSDIIHCIISKVKSYSPLNNFTLSSIATFSVPLKNVSE